MNKAEYLELIRKTEINADRAKEIRELFNHDLDDMLLKVISAADGVDFFDEERRALSYNEIVGASELLGIDAVADGIVPVIDAYDCTFIVYLLHDGKWGKYNMVDKETYKERDSLEEVV